MVFSSISFLLFLAVTCCLYHLIPGLRARNILLLIASLLFYTLGEPVYILLLLASSVVNYFLARGIAAAGEQESAPDHPTGKSVNFGKTLLTVAVVFNIGLLVLFKYAGLGLRLPIGISFYTFQTLSYVIDVYRGDARVQKRYPDLLLYITFFPQLIAGPIVKYHDIADQLAERKTSAEKTALGLRRFIFGLAKKVLIANTCAVAVDQIYALAPEQLCAASAWTAALLYALQIYYDFSGYSDMALGMAGMFGFFLKENFAHPYGATTIKAFWRRWHISLSTWFKEYLYIPLGGNRKGATRTMLNKYIVFFLTGLWHGAGINFVIWGLIHGTFSVLEERGKWAKRLQGNVIGWIYTALVVVLAFVFFRAETVGSALTMIRTMFTGFSPSAEAASLAIRPWDPYTIAMAVTGALLMFDWKARLTRSGEKTLSRGLETAGFLLSLGLLVLCVMGLVSGSYNPFIYFRF